MVSERMCILLLLLLLLLLLIYGRFAMADTQSVRRTVTRALTQAPRLAASTTDAMPDTSTKLPTELATVSSSASRFDFFSGYNINFFFIYQLPVTRGLFSSAKS